MSTDDNAENVPLLDMTEAMKARGPEFVIGFDIPRTWVTGGQAFINPDFSLLVFREQIAMNDPDTQQPSLAMKNVASIALPTQTLRELAALINSGLAALDDQPK